MIDIVLYCKRGRRLFKLFQFVRELLYGKGTVSSIVVDWDAGEVKLSLYSPGNEEEIISEIKEYCDLHQSLSFSGE